MEPNLQQLEDGSFLLECQRVYQLEPGRPISIISGDAVINITYDSTDKQTRIEVAHPSWELDKILYDLDIH